MPIRMKGVSFLLVVTVSSFFLQQFAGDGFVYSFALWPLQQGFMPWQLASYALLHGSVMHLAFNMYGLWLFGTEMEKVIGRRILLKLYVASVLSAGALQLLVTSSNGSAYPTVGASGGVFGLLLAYGMCFPSRIIMLLIPPIPMRVWVFVTLYGGLELYLGVTGSQEGVAHFAHLGGMAGGYWVIRNWLRHQSKF